MFDGTYTFYSWRSVLYARGRPIHHRHSLPTKFVLTSLGERDVCMRSFSSRRGNRLAYTTVSVLRFSVSNLQVNSQGLSNSCPNPKSWIAAQGAKDINPPSQGYGCWFGGGHFGFIVQAGKVRSRSVVRAIFINFTTLSEKHGWLALIPRKHTEKRLISGWPCKFVSAFAGA